MYKKDAAGNWSHYNNGNGGWTQAGKLGSTKKSGSAIERNKPNQTLSGATRAGEGIKRDNLPKPDQNLGGATRLGDGIERDNFPKANQTLGQRDKPLGEAGRSDITHDLDRSAFSRDRGESQTRNFQNIQREGNRLGGGNFRGGGGFRGRR